MGILEGKRALVAGVANAKSIAWGIAQSLDEHGAKVALTCVPSTHRRVAKLAAQIGCELVFDCDVNKDEDITRVMEEVGWAFDGKLDVLVHSIAYARLEDMGGEFINVPREGWRLALEVSAYSLVAMTRAARPLLKAAGGGSVMTVSFCGGVKVAPSYNVMGIAKAALESAVRYLTYDLGPDNIRVNALSPGPILTMSSMVIDHFDESLQKMVTHSPMLKYLSAQDVGRAAVFLASDLSSMISGTVIDIDGGMHILMAGTLPHPRAAKTPAAPATDTKATPE